MGLGAVSLIDHLPEDSGKTIVVFVTEGNEAKWMQLVGGACDRTHHLHQSADRTRFRSHVKFCQGAFTNCATELCKSAGS